MISLEVKQFVKGICFICGEACKPEHYCHYVCAIAHDDEKRKRIKEAQI